MTRMLFYTHSGTRWLVLLAAAVALGFMLFSLIRNREQDRFTRLVMVIFSSLVGIQWLVGVILVIVYNNLNRTWQGYWTWHLGIMTAALIVAHLYLPARRRASTRTYYLVSLAVIVGFAVLVVWGVSVLPPNELFAAARWSMRPIMAPGG
ncbi:MAG: hypothetical protein ACOYL5_08935 [Phototrophicaceae bacterium]